MKRTQLGTTTVGNALLMALILLSLTGCFSSDRGSDLGGGDVEPQTNSLTSPTSLDLVLDTITFDGNVPTLCNSNINHACLEIHIMDEDNDTLLACVGYQQARIMRYMGNSFLTYSDVNANFLKSSSVSFTDDTNINLRLVNKRSISTSRACPNGYRSNTTSSYNNDEVLASVSTTFGDLFDDFVEFPGYATATFRTSSEPAEVIDVTASEENGQLVLDQLYIDDDYIWAGELSLPELALGIQDADDNSIVTCANLVDIDYGGIQYATMSYGFEDDSGLSFTNSDLDPTIDYRVVLMELDGISDCNQETPIYQTLAQTGTLSASDIYDQNHTFTNGYGNFTIVLQ